MDGKLRGGSWYSLSAYLRCAARPDAYPRSGWSPYGFRVVRVSCPGHKENKMMNYEETIK